MIKYFCDLCGQEITPEYVQFLDTGTIRQRDGDAVIKRLHLHNKCLHALLDAVEEKLHDG